MFTARSNIDEVQRRIQKIAKKTKFAESEAINQSAKFAAMTQRSRARAAFDRPTPFLLNGIYNPKTKLGFVGVFSRFSTLEAQLIPGAPRGNFREGGRRINEVLFRQAFGGQRTPDKRALVVPVSPQAKNKYGNLPGGKIKKLLARPDAVQLGARDGLPPGIYRRLRGGRLKMLVAYEPSATYQRRFDYFGVGNKAFRKVFKKQFDRALAEEMKRL